MYMPPKGIAFFKKKKKKKESSKLQNKKLFSFAKFAKMYFLSKQKRGSLSLTIFSLIYVNFTHQMCFNDVLLL